MLGDIHCILYCEYDIRYASRCYDTCCSGERRGKNAIDKHGIVAWSLPTSVSCFKCVHHHSVRNASTIPPTTKEKKRKEEKDRSHRLQVPGMVSVSRD